MHGQELAPLRKTTSPPMLAPCPWKPCCPACRGSGEQGPGGGLTLAPFWAGASTLPSGPKTVPGSPFSP